MLSERYPTVNLGPLSQEARACSEDDGDVSTGTGISPTECPRGVRMNNDGNMLNPLSKVGEGDSMQSKETNRSMMSSWCLRSFRAPSHRMLSDYKGA